MNAITDRPHWSYSSISQYLKCPLQYYFERILGLPRRTTSDAQVLGASIHAALAFHHRKLKAREVVAAHQVHDTFLAAWENQTSQFEVVYDKRSAADNHALGIALIEVYLQEPPPANIVAVEAPMLTPITNSRGEVLEKPLLVVLDLITRQDDGIPKIVEIKTTSRAYSDSEVATSLQPSCYASALYELTGQEPLIEYAVLVKTKAPKVQRIEAIRTIPDFRRLGDIIEAVERGVESEVYYPIESPLNCSSCPYFRECRGWTGPGSSKSGEHEVVITEEAAPC
jgi:putative RecB family exonuclease